MKKGLLILDNPKYKDSQTFYQTEENETDFHLIYASIDKTWTNPGKKAYSLINTGDFFVFRDHHTKTQIKLDYCQAQAIRALLKLEDKDGCQFNYFESKSR